jgi:hypothetical protein
MLRIFTLLLLTAAAGLANTITYTLTATASGSLDGTSFTDSLLTITAVANTGETASPLTPSSSTVTVGSVSDTFNDEGPYLFVATSCNGFVPAAPCAGFGTNTALRDIVDIANSAFATYTLGTAIGPVTDPTPIATTGLDFADDSGGDLILSSVTDGSFTAALSPVPEPSSLGMLCSALFAIGICFRRRLVAGL